MTSTEVVADPVAHISISGVHGRDELADRVAHAPTYAPARGNPYAFVLIGAVLGAALVYFLKRE